MKAISDTARKKYIGAILCLAAVIVITFSSVTFFFNSRLNKEAIARRTRNVIRVDRYERLSPDRKLTVDEILSNREKPDVLKRIYIEAVRKDGVTEKEAMEYTKVLMCTAFAETLAQYLGNRIPPYAGDAWTIYRKNPDFRLYQIYPESIDLYSIRKLKRGGGPSIPDSSSDNPPLSTGDIITMPIGTLKYVYHSGVVITDTKSSPHKKYFIESRGRIAMHEICGGNIRFQSGSGGFKLIPIAEVVGDI